MSAPPFADFPNLEKGSKPNRWLVAPAGLLPGTAKADAEAPRFGVSPEKLFAALREAVQAQPRVSEVEIDPLAKRLRYTQAVPVVGFKDDIDAVVLDAEGGSTLAVFSRSRVGYGDFGVNKRRVKGLLEALAERV